MFLGFLGAEQQAQEDVRTGLSDLQMDMDNFRPLPSSVENAVTAQFQGWTTAIRGTAAEIARTQQMFSDFVTGGGTQRHAPSRPPQMREGGLISGPRSGYPVEAHGTERVFSLEPEMRQRSVAMVPELLGELGVPASTAPRELSLAGATIQVLVPDGQMATMKREIDREASVAGRKRAFGL